MKFYVDSSVVFDNIFLGGFMGADHSPKQIVMNLMDMLDTSPTSLAGMLGVSERSLSDWKGRTLANLPPKAHRLTRLYEVVKMVKTLRPDYSTQKIKALLENGRIPLGGADDEESISLIGYIQAEPTAKTWQSCLQSAIEDFENFIGHPSRERRHASI